MNPNSSQNIFPVFGKYDNGRVVLMSETNYGYPSNIKNGRLTIKYINIFFKNTCKHDMVNLFFSNDDRINKSNFIVSLPINKETFSVICDREIDVNIYDPKDIRIFFSFPQHAILNSDDIISATISGNVIVID